MANGKIPNFNNKFYGDKLVEVTFPDSTGSLGFDEYNATLNNANSSITSSKIMDADYALNARIPTNNDRLLSGTAQRMEIQDSNYSSVAWTSPRYVGSKTISATYNDYQASGSSVTFADGTTGTWKGDQVFDEYPGDATFRRGNPLGKVPAVDLYSTHFVLFDRIQIDEGFADGDIFHCLYLIDDQGNKRPLSYKNKNLVDLQRLYTLGSNAEVVFLAQNNQEVLDEYPILSVGSISSDRATFTNDLIQIDTTADTYLPEFNTLQIATSNALLKNINNRKYDFTIRFVPSMFRVQNTGLNEFKLSYSDSNIRSSFNSSGVNMPFRKAYNRKTTLTPNSTFYTNNTQFPIDYPIIDGDQNMSSISHDSKFDPFYFLTYNPQTSKIFEGTLLEQEVDWNIVAYDPGPFQTNLQGFSNFPIGINSVDVRFPGLSRYENTWSPIKIGDTLRFSRIPIQDSVGINQIGVTNVIASSLVFQNFIPTSNELSGQEVSDNLSDFYSPTSFLECDITDLNLTPISQSMRTLVNPVNGKFVNVYETFDENGDDIVSVFTEVDEDGSWVSSYNDTTGGTYSFKFPILREIPPTFTNFSTSNQRNYLPATPGDQSPTYPDYAIGNMIILGDWTSYNVTNLGNIMFSSEGVFALLVDKRTMGGVDKSSFLESLTHGDIIKLVRVPNYNQTPHYTSDYDPNEPLRSIPDADKVTYKVIQTPIQLTGGGVAADKYMIRVDQISPQSSITFGSIQTYAFGNKPRNRIIISDIIKFNPPFIKMKTNPTFTVGDVSGSIQTSGSALSVVGVNIHEQYITSQFLEGSGVGALIPENYDPKLREQLPDIINKTGIDINSLTQGNN